MLPHNYDDDSIAEGDAAADPSSLCPAWYHGPIGRLYSEAILGKGDIGQGGFLVRDSESSRNDLTMSIRNGARVVHCRVVRNSKGEFKGTLLPPKTKPKKGCGGGGGSGRLSTFPTPGRLVPHYTCLLPPPGR